jgi:hypothetical protein
MPIISQLIARDEPLCDGTPGREKGWRAYVTTEAWGYDRNVGGGRRRIHHKSPLFATEDQALAWRPEEPHARDEVTFSGTVNWGAEDTIENVLAAFDEAAASTRQSLAEIASKSLQAMKARP